jgi:hypothetical protein
MMQQTLGLVSRLGIEFEYLIGIAKMVPQFLLYTSVYYNNNINQAFYSQASWDRLEMKPHEPKKRYKIRAKKNVKTKGDKKPNKKGEKTIKR